MSKILVWLHSDLRLMDNPALYHAAQLGEVVPVYVLNDRTSDDYSLGGAHKWWLHHALKSLATSFSMHGINLILVRGKSSEIIDRLARECGVSAVYSNKAYEPHLIKETTLLEKNLKRTGIEFKKFHSYLLFKQEEVRNNSGAFFKVFTPFWRHCLNNLAQPQMPLPLPKFSKSSKGYKSEKLADWGLCPVKPDWAGGLAARWVVSEDAAHNLLQDFVENKLNGYAKVRDFPAINSCSNLSPYLHFGMISPGQVWHEVIRTGHTRNVNAERFLAELGWREFSYHTLFNFPLLPEKPYRAEFEHFPWSYNAMHLKVWQRGETGIPIVDAGMRELWQTGFMHNRVRMIVASFLTKNLLMHWKQGAEWFWDTLVDADLANNSANWQWVAGSGTDSSPYFRIFNPVLQGEKFDPDGEYVKKYVPELVDVLPQYIHKPWKLEKALIPKHYPKPIVDLKTTRDAALQAYKEMRKSVGVN